MDRLKGKRALITGGSSGIGLFIAKQFVEGHGGKISIESHIDLDKHGTLVRVFMPVHTQYEVSETR